VTERVPRLFVTALADLTQWLDPAICNYKLQISAGGYRAPRSHFGCLTAKRTLRGNAAEIQCGDGLMVHGAI
jgi:hypothetical protein